MQAKLMSVSLQGFAQLMTAIDCKTAAADYQELADIMADAGTKTVAFVVKKILQHWKVSDRSPSYPATLKIQLTGTIDALKASKTAKAVLTDYHAVLTLCAGSDDANAGDFLEDMRIAFNAPPPAAKKVVKKRVAMTPLEAREIADKLTGLLQNNVAFDAAVAELSTPRKYTAKDLTAIAECFLGYKRPHKNKDAIIIAIKKRQLQDAIGDAMDRRIETIPG